MKQIHVFTVFGTPESFYDGQFRYLADHGHEIILVSSDDAGAEAFAERNHIKFIPVEMPRALSPVAILRAIRQLSGIIKAERPDAVFGHTPVGALCAMIAAMWCRVSKRIYYRHGVIYTTMKGVRRSIFKLEERFVASMATVVVNVSHSLSKLAIRDHLNPGAKQYVIGHGSCGGIDAVNIFNPERLSSEKLAEIQTKLGLTDADIVYGFCGRICNDKGVPELVDAFDLFRKNHSDINAKLLLIGAIDIRDGISKQYVHKITNDSDILLSGHIEKKNIPYYYALLDVFVLPSHREGFGMCAIEAGAMAKPLLVSKVHGCEDTIVPHVTGEYIGQDAQSICRGMQLLLNQDLRNELGQNGRIKVLEWYDFRVMWPLVKSLYDKILN